jgi:hypothetical protein
MVVHRLEIKAEGSRLKDRRPNPQRSIPHSQSTIRMRLVSLPARVSIDFFLPPVPRFLPYNALRSELAVELWINAFTAVIDVQTLAALLTESGFMLVADPNRLSVWVIPALHHFLTPVPFFSRFETGRGLSRT